MASASDFLKFWALAFVTLSVALVLLNVFYRLIDSDLGLDGFRKEATIAVIASAVQGAGFWFSASLFHGQPFRQLLLPELIIAIIYYLTHLKDWSGLEIGGILFFQSTLMMMAFFLAAGQFKLLVITLAAFAAGLAIIASIARSL